MRTITAQENKFVQVWLNFRDVSFDTFEAYVPDRQNFPWYGYVKMYQRNKEGYKFVVGNTPGTRRPATKICYGIIWWKDHKKPWWTDRKIGIYEKILSCLLNSIRKK